MIEPVWPYSNRISVFTTTRNGGVSAPPFDSFNLADQVGDDGQAVHENRRRLSERLESRPIHWLDQVHGTEVVEARGEPAAVPQADGIWTRDPDAAVAVLTADCLPVVLAEQGFRVAGVAHGGWRGLVGGILEATVEALPGADWIAWIGPGIGPTAYEVGDDVLSEVRALPLPVERAILPGDRPGKGYLDLFTLAELQLEALGVREIYCERICTASNESLYSYRRDGETGRMATVVALSD
jgi:YfiH family protein